MTRNRWNEVDSGLASIHDRRGYPLIIWFGFGHITTTRTWSHHNTTSTPHRHTLRIRPEKNTGQHRSQQQKECKQGAGKWAHWTNTNNQQKDKYDIIQLSQWSYYIQRKWNKRSPKRASNLFLKYAKVLDSTLPGKQFCILTKLRWKEHLIFSAEK